MGDFIRIWKVDIRNDEIETGDIEKLEAAIIALKPLIDVLNLTETDDMDWYTTCKSFEYMLQIYQDTWHDTFIFNFYIIFWTLYLFHYI